MSTDITRYYWTNGRHSIIEVNESNTQDVSRPFPNLIPTETLVFCFYLRKFANSWVTYPYKSKLAK